LNLQLVTGQQGISSYNIAGFICEVSEEVATQIAKNCRRRQPHSQKEPRRISACTSYFHKLESLIYIKLLSPIVWVYLHLNLCSRLQSTHHFCNRVRICRSRSFRVIQGRWFWYRSKARMRLLISPSLWLWSYLAPCL